MANYRGQDGSLSIGLSNGAGPTGTPTATPSTTGGALAAATYHYIVTAITSGGETLGSSEFTATTTTGTSSVTLAWAAVAGATNYKVYRGLGAGTENLYYLTTTNAFTDVGGTANFGNIPTALGVGVAQVKSWDATVMQALMDASTMGTDWVLHRGGMASWNGSLAVLFDYGDPGQKQMVDKLCAPTPDGTVITVALQILGSTKEIVGDVIPKQIAVTDTLNDLVQIKLDFEGSGPPALSWS